MNTFWNPLPSLYLIFFFLNVSLLTGRGCVSIPFQFKYFPPMSGGVPFPPWLDRCNASGCVGGASVGGLSHSIGVAMTTRIGRDLQKEGRYQYHTSVTSIS